MDLGPAAQENWALARRRLELYHSWKHLLKPLMIKSESDCKQTGRPGMSGVVITGLVILGLCLLLLSIVPISEILTITPKGPVRCGWLTLAVLLFLFIPGYAAFAWLQRSAPVELSTLIVAGLLLVGACFVLGVTILARQTATEIIRVAALERNAFTDDLTGLFNRRYLSLRISNDITRALSHGADFSLIMLDIDRFKSINDTYGHQTGDEVLRAVASAVAQNIRLSDIAVRYGGEEFIVVAVNTNKAEALRLAERLRDNIEGLPIPIDHGRELRVSASLGVASLRNGDDIHSLLRRADNALYCAKRRGRNRVCEEDEALNTLDK